MPDTKLNKKQLDTLRKSYEKIDRVDPSSQEYKNLKAALKLKPDSTLKQLADAKIRFVSKLAVNELERRKKKGGWEYSKLYKSAGLEESVKKYLDNLS